MMETTRDSSDPFGGLSTQRRAANSPSLTRLALMSVKAEYSFHVSATIKANLQQPSTFDLV